MLNSVFHREGGRLLSVNVAIGAAEFKMKLLVLVVLTILMIECGGNDSFYEGSKSSRGSDVPTFVSRQESPDKTFNYSGVSPKNSVDRALFAARQWNANASLQAVLANKWELYGEPQNGEVRGITIPEWRFVFVGDDRVGSFIVTRDTVRLMKDEAKPHPQPTGSPLAGPFLAHWEIDAAKALDTAYEAGVAISEGPWLWMRIVEGQPEPVWTILAPPGAPIGSVFISAKTGRRIPNNYVK